MQNKLRGRQAAYDAIVFLPAITPLEAAVLRLHTALKGESK